MKPSLKFSVLAAVALTLTVVSCATHPPAGQFPPGTPACEIDAGTGRAPDSVRVVVFDPIDVYKAPWSRNDGEKMVFAHLYETLITVDCASGVRAALATSWKKRDGGRVWEFELRRDARFWDGSRVRAADVVWTWQLAALESGSLHELVDSARAGDEGRLRVYLAQAYPEVPEFLASDEFATARPSVDFDWLLGSGSYRFAAAEKGRVVAVPVARAGQSVLVFTQAAARDARDALSGSVDMMATRDPETIAYAGRAGFGSAELPWDRTYVLVLPAEGSLRRVSGAAVRDAVRCDARPSLAADVATLCGASPPATGLGPQVVMRRAVVYDDSDPTARDVAERVVARSAATEPGLRAEGTPAGELQRRLATAGDVAYVICVPAATYEMCRSQLRARSAHPHGAWIPLVDTRAHLIFRGSGCRFSFDAFGNVRIEGQR